MSLNDILHESLKKKKALCEDAISSGQNKDLAVC